MGKPVIKWGAVIVLLFVSLPAFSASWESVAKKQFETDKYESSIESAEDHKKDKNNKIGLMLLAFSHLQLNEFNDTKTDKRKFKNYFELLEDTVNADHLTDIHYFIQQVDKPEVVKQARVLLKKAFKNVKDVSDAPLLLPFAKADDEKTRKLALSALKSIVNVKRKYVTKGGTLRNKDIIILQDERIIRALLENVNISDAFNTLVAIEQPVLSYVGDYEGTKVIKLEEKINKAIAKREKKYLDSTWYSATGALRDKAIIL